MSTPAYNSPFSSNYDPSIFYTPIYSYADEVGMPVHGLVKYPIKLTITLKDIGLEGLDSSTPDKTSRIKRRELQRMQKIMQKSQDNSIPQQQKINPPIIPLKRDRPRFSPRIRKLLEEQIIHEPIYEGTFYKSKCVNLNIESSSDDPKPIGLLASTQKPQKPQTIIPKAGQKSSRRLNTFESSNESGAFKDDEK